MKKIYLVSLLVVIGIVGQSQYVFNKGGLALNAGIGVLSGNGFIPSINVSGELGILPTGDIGLLSVGAIVAYKYSTYSYSLWDESYNYNQIAFGPRAIWHLQTFKSEKWDAYAGAGFGFRTWSDYVINNDFTDLERKTRLSPYGEAFVGGRMMLKNGFGLFAEVGYGTLSSIKFGATFMLK